MSRFIETIRATNGRVGDLRFHQQRVDETLQAFHASSFLSLIDIIQQQTIPNYPITKIRITYTLQGMESIQLEPYTLRSIHSLSFIDMGKQHYAFKYAERGWLQALVANAATDDVILCQGDLIKDASYANLAFFDGNAWYTPRRPLLNGTKRRALVQEGLLIEKEIVMKDLASYESVKLVNAMMLWEEAPTIPLAAINR